MEEGLAKRLVQVGIRTLNRHCREQAARFGVEIIEARHFHPGAVPRFAGPLYISIDMDGDARHVRVESDDRRILDAVDGA